VNNIGLHIRLTNKISVVAEKASRLQLPFFQTFLIDASKRFIRLEPRDKQRFLALRPQFGKLFLHASYWTNCVSSQRNTNCLLDRELYIAQLLKFNYFILHPGAISRYQTRESGINLIAKRLNRAIEKFPDITILLENVAHGKRSIGGDIHELQAIYNQITFPHRLGFCIDTAHAHVYGYNLSHTAGQKKFIKLLNDTISLKNIRLIHLNDTSKPASSHIDLHAIPGRGRIGKQNLLRFVHHPKLKNVPLILELPVLEESKEKTIIQELKEW